jgi:dihydroflavonol-4-reductase
MILVTGAAGHIGNVLVRELLLMGEQVRALVLPGEDTCAINGLDIEMVEGDVLDPESLDRAMVGVDRVFHLAGIISIMPGQEELMHRVNAIGPRNVAEAALKAGVKRMLHVSSIHALKRMPDGFVVDEAIPFEADGPVGTYNQSKAEGAKEVLKVVRKGLDAVIVCPTGVIGPYDFRKSEMGQTLLGFTRRRLHFLVDGNYDFIDVRDVVQGIILACQKGRTGETYILSGYRVNIRQIKHMVQEIAGIYAPGVTLPFSMAEFFANFTELFYRWANRVPQFTRYSLRTVRENSFFSSRKAVRELGHNPRSLRESIKDTLNWWKEYKRNLIGI